MRKPRSQGETDRNWCALLISRWREAVREFSLAMWRREANDDARAVVAKKPVRPQRLVGWDSRSWPRMFESARYSCRIASCSKHDRAHIAYPRKQTQLAALGAGRPAKWASVFEAHSREMRGHWCAPLMAPIGSLTMWCCRDRQLGIAGIFQEYLAQIINVAASVASAR